MESDQQGVERTERVSDRDSGPSEFCLSLELTELTRLASSLFPLQVHTVAPVKQSATSETLTPRGILRALDARESRASARSCRLDGEAT